MVDVDVPRFAHALDNLVDNAITYTRPGGHIVLSAAAVGSNVTLSVSDTGVGIPAEYLPRVFERFFQVPGRNRKYSGTGLGLAIVREIVTAHGGTITCESRRRRRHEIHDHAAGANAPTTNDEANDECQRMTNDE